MILFLTLMSAVPSLWARSAGAPTDACPNLMPQHPGAAIAPNNTGFFLMSEVIDSGTYIPGRQYPGKTVMSEFFRRILWSGSRD